MKTQPGRGPEYQNKDRLPVFVDLVYVFWTLQAIEPRHYGIGVTIIYRTREASIQDHRFAVLT